MFIWCPSILEVDRHADGGDTVNGFPFRQVYYQFNFNRRLVNDASPNFEFGDGLFIHLNGVSDPFAACYIPAPWHFLNFLPEPQ